MKNNDTPQYVEKYTAEELIQINSLIENFDLSWNHAAIVLDHLSTLDGNVFINNKVSQEGKSIVDLKIRELHSQRQLTGYCYWVV